MSETARSHEVWSFVQMLPLFLLSLPLLAAWELYKKERICDWSCSFRILITPHIRTHLG